MQYQLLGGSISTLYGTHHRQKAVLNIEILRQNIKQR